MSRVRSPSSAKAAELRLLSVSDVHSCRAWMARILERMADHDALLLPGDLCQGFAADMEPRWRAWAEFFDRLAAMNRPVIFCTGNHDEGLIPYLQPQRSRWPRLHWDGEVLEIGGIRIAALAYQQPLREAGADHLWLYHEPPLGTPLAEDHTGGRAFGCPNLEAVMNYVPDSLPPLVISGHQHSPAAWQCRRGRTLFLNSGQTEGAPTPEHFVIELRGGEATITRRARQQVRTRLW